jgi:hypothetical protein
VPTDEYSSLVGIASDTLGAALLVAKLSLALEGVEVTLQALYAHESIAALAEFLTAGGEEAAAATMVEARGSAVGASLPSPKPPSGVASRPQRCMQGLKGALVLWVVLEHCGPWGPRGGGGGWSWRSHAAPSLLLLASGYGLRLQYADLGRPGVLRAYVWSRAVGVFPLYYLALLLQLPRAWGAPAARRLPSVLLYLAGLQSWWAPAAEGLPELGFASWQWSAYLLLPLLLPLLRGVGWAVRGAVGPSGPLAVVAAYALLALLVGLGSMAARLHAPAASGQHVLLHLGEFVLGLLVADARLGVQGMPAARSAPPAGASAAVEGVSHKSRAVDVVLCCWYGLDGV